MQPEFTYLGFKIAKTISSLTRKILKLLKMPKNPKMYLN